MAVNLGSDNDRQCMYKHNTGARSHVHFCLGTAVSITYSEYVSVALFTQHAMRMRPIIFPSVPCLAVPNFSTLSHKRLD